jgi:SAM-dependent methyltransferase
MEKSIDFDLVADLYDVYVRSDADVGFWADEVSSVGGDVLELMCGSGRIGYRLIEAGFSYTGIDYSQKLLDLFREKLAAGNRSAELVHADARSVSLARSFAFIFIGFHSLSEVLGREERLGLLQHAREHLEPSGRFTFSLQNPAVRKLSLDGERSTPVVVDFADGERILQFSAQLYPPSPEGRVTGTQFYEIKDRQGRTIEQRELDIQFDLVTMPEAEELITRAGFRVERLWGNYDRTAYLPTSPFMIYRCTAA